jgi:hypothetical protein
MAAPLTNPNQPMSSILNKIKSGPTARPQKSVIYGAEGIGKSTLASQFPTPLFLDLEDGTAHLSVRRLTRTELPTCAAVRAAIREIAQAGPEVAGTVVLDTVDWLESMAAEEVIAEANDSKITSIESFGYGKGYTYLREKVTLVLADLDRCIRSGQHVVLLAHSRVARHEPPDSAAYDRYELKMSKQVAPLVKEWADCLLFGNFVTLVTDGKGVGGKKRRLWTERTAAIEAKNRVGLEPTADWGIEPIREAFKAAGIPWDTAPAATKPEPKPAPKPAAKKPAPAPKPEPAQEPEDNLDMTPAPAPAPEPAQADDPFVICMQATFSPPEIDAVNQWLVETGKIEPGQSFADLPEDYKARIIKRPEAFRAAVLKGGAK